MPKDSIDLLSLDTNDRNDTNGKKDINASSNTEEKKHVPFAVVEAYKRIRTNLTFLLAQDEGNRTIVLTSANAGEGKSTTSSNLGVAFSQLEKKVLLIDADMRKGTVHKKFKRKNGQGLSNILSGMISVEEATVQINNNLSIITAGDVPPNPSELLDSKRFSELLDYANKNYDLVIVDTPPLNIVSDALVVAPNTAGVILIVHDGYTPHYSIKKAIEAIEFANAKLLGVIMNGANAYDKGRYSYRKYKYYSKHYSYGYEYKRGSSSK